MRRAQLSLGLTIMAGIALGGCASTPTAPAEPTTAPAPVAAVGPAPTKVTPPKDVTHVLTKDEPYYASEPTPGSPPSGTFKSGTKLLLVLPGATYSQVVSDTGIQAYTETDGLKPLGK